MFVCLPCFIFVLFWFCFLSLFLFLLFLLLLLLLLLPLLLSFLLSLLLLLYLIERWQSTGMSWIFSEANAFNQDKTRLIYILLFCFFFIYIYFCFDFPLFAFTFAFAFHFSKFERCQSTGTRLICSSCVFFLFFGFRSYFSLTCSCMQQYSTALFNPPPVFLLSSDRPAPPNCSSASSSLSSIPSPVPDSVVERDVFLL